MCITIDQACGFVVLNKLNTFVYCCKTCSREFALGQDFEVHVLSKHNREDDDSVDVCGDIFAECTSDSMQIEAANIKIEQYEEYEYPPFDSVNHDFDNDIGNNESVNINPNLSQGLLPENSGEYLLEIKSDEPDEINTNVTAAKRKRGRPMGKKKKQNNKNVATSEKSFQKSPEPLISFQCYMCPDKSFTKKGLKGHMRIHLRFRKWKKKQINSSAAISDNSITFECEMCPGRTFSNKRGLKSHMHVHIRKPKIDHKCDYCDKTFKYKSNKIEHMRNHTGEKMLYLCGVCGKSYRNRSSFYAHRELHSIDQNKHKCPECGKGFQRKFTMNEHIIQCHTNSRPFTCNICGGSFATNRYLRHHKNVHKKKNPCRCCGKKFRYPHETAVHERAVHGMIIPQSKLEDETSHN